MIRATDTIENSASVPAKVRSVRQRTIFQQRLVQCGVLLLTWSVLFATLAVLDFFMVFGWSVRAAMFAAAVATAATLAVIRWRSRQRYDDLDAAAAVESKFPQHGQRIRTALDYSDPAVKTAPAARGLVRAMHSETEQQTQHVDFEQVIDRRPLLVTTACIFTVAAACLIAAVVNPELWVSAGRTLLLPLQYTHLTVAPIEEAIPAGQNVTISATISGRPVANAAVLFRAADSQDEWSTVPLLPLQIGDESDGGEPAPEQRLSGDVAATLADLQADLEFKVVAGPIEHELQRLRVLLPLEMEQFTATIHPPEYTRRDVETVETLDLKMIEGSNVEFELTLNRPAAEATLVLISDEEADDGRQASGPPLEILDNRVSGRFADVRQTQQYVVHARAADGIEFESGRLRIRVQPDAKPRIRFLQPPEDLEVTPTTEVTLAVTASDDFGINKVGLLCKVGDGPMTTLWERDYTNDSDSVPAELNAEPVLFLEDHELTFKDAVTYYAFAEDNFPTKPRRSLTELRFIDIRPYKREYQVIKSSGGT